jgi:glycosyltransferase A (GT-A) superfamily protein (DUF2064 family)
LPGDRIVLVFARAPRDESRAKPLVDSASGAAVEALHDGLLRRALAVARATGVHTRLVTTRDAGSFSGASDLDVALQRGASFAERLENAVADAFATGWREVVVIGADTPHLEPQHLRRAFAELGRSSDRRAVLGPACDGGYYLLALNAFAADVFRGIPLGTRNACDATAAALARAGYLVATLPPLRDVDDVDDLRWLWESGGWLRRAALAVLAPLALRATRSCALPSSVYFAAIHARGPPALPSITS